METLLSGDQLNEAVIVSMTDQIMEAVAALPNFTAEAMARTVHGVVVKRSLQEGQKPEIEVALKKPGEPRHFADATCWCVVWEAGPYEWAISVSMALTMLTGKVVEPYYSFDLCFYPNQD